MAFATSNRMSKSLIVGLLVVCLATSAFGLTMKVEPKTEECFTENLGVGEDVEARWGVQDGGLLDIDVRVRGLRGICVGPSFSEFKSVPYALAYTDKSRTISRVSLLWLYRSSMAVKSSGKSSFSKVRRKVTTRLPLLPPAHTPSASATR